MQIISRVTKETLRKHLDVLMLSVQEGKTIEINLGVDESVYLVPKKLFAKLTREQEK